MGTEAPWLTGAKTEPKKISKTDMGMIDKSITTKNAKATISQNRRTRPAYRPVVASRTISPTCRRAMPLGRAASRH